MISDADYTAHDGLGLAALVRSGQLSATELLDAAVARIERLDPALNAIVRKRYDAARAEIAQVDPRAPFAGVPFLLKDLCSTIAGEPTGSGNRVLAQVPMPQDSEMVRRWRAAGLVIAGRSSTPEFGLVPTTEPLLHGPTRNPWSPAHSAGGSSGGSAAAVAAGLVPLASGGDGGGSIRIPAACCGLFGFKPSRGSTPTGPLFGELWHGLVIAHVISHSVRDSAAALDAYFGADAGAPYAAPARARPFLDELSHEPGRLRIAFTAQPLFGHGTVHPDCVAALHAAAKLLEGLGHYVEEATPPLDAEADALAFATLLAGETRAEIELLSRRLGRRLRPAHFEPATWALGLLGRTLGAGTYAGAAMQLQTIARRQAGFFAGFDVLLTPTLAAPPAPLGTLQPARAEQALMHLVNALGAGWLLHASGAVAKLAAKTFAYMPYTAMFNATGQPAMSLPLHWDAEGLPIGVQCVARLGDDATLLRLAAQVERARPWFDRRPPRADVQGCAATITA